MLEKMNLFTETEMPLFQPLYSESPVYMYWDDDDEYDEEKDEDDDSDDDYAEDWGWTCSPDYCMPDAYNTCNPEFDSDGGCDPSYDDQF